MSRLDRLLDAPEPAFRIELIRTLAPLAILGFLSSRIAYANEWLGTAGFHVPDLGGGDHRQPLFLPALPPALAWTIAAVLVAAGLSLAFGTRRRASALIFAAALAWVALADRSSAFTVTKLSLPIALALAAAPTNRPGSWLERRPASVLRFFQALIVVFYASSGVCKLRSDWLHHPHVLFTHLHDSYQTVVSFALASTLPPLAWTIVQGAVLALECLAPLWFGWKRSRPYALAAAILMHALIGVMFWPVRWFALLMIVLLVGCFLPERAAQCFGRGKRE